MAASGVGRMCHGFYEVRVAQSGKIGPPRGASQGPFVRLETARTIQVQIDQRAALYKFERLSRRSKISWMQR